MKKITILGSTGSIGMNTLDVLSQHPKDYQIFALTAYQQIEPLVKQCLLFKPRYVVVGNESAAKLFRKLTENLVLKTELLVGKQALCEVASNSEVDIVMAAIVGSAGLEPTLAAIYAGKKVLLANKETLVMAGDLVLEAVAQSGAQLLPVDSEHSAIFQCLPADFLSGRLFQKAYSSVDQTVLGIKKLVLTASGGAIRDLPLDQLDKVSVEFACKHPTWVMGKKISIDSATMMNKALEVIEAYYLFGLPCEKIEVILHPQSIVHSLVYYEDGSILAQLGQADMRTPIAYALAWPVRIFTQVPLLDLTQTVALSFSELDHKRYCCLNLAYQALKAGGLAPTILNAANEVAVEAFLKQQITFPEIYYLNEAMLTKIDSLPSNKLENIQAVDYETRQRAMAWIKREKLKNRIF